MENTVLGSQSTLHSKCTFLCALCNKETLLYHHKSQVFSQSRQPAPFERCALISLSLSMIQEEESLPYRFHFLRLRPLLLER